MQTHRREDCLLSCDCDVANCQHAHNANCDSGECILKRLSVKAPAMSGAARTAMMAWLDVMSARMAGPEGPSGWSRQHKLTYLASLSSVSGLVAEKGSTTVYTPLIQILNKRIKKTLKTF